MKTKIRMKDKYFETNDPSKDWMNVFDDPRKIWMDEFYDDSMETMVNPNKNHKESYKRAMKFI